MSEQQIYKTKDIYLTSYLVMRGHFLEKLEKKDDKFFFFIFPDTKELQSDVKGFYNREATVQPMQYVVAMKQVKSKIYNND